MKARRQSPGSPLSGRYLVRNPGWNAALRVTDAVLARVAQAKSASMPNAPRRILIAVGGHMGDAVIATSVLPVLSRAFPDAELGMLLPSWSREAVSGHPRLSWLHHADHWKMSRSSASPLAKWSAYQESGSHAVDEIRSMRYDAAIDLYAYYPNAAWLLWRAGIPVRVGYTSGGCGPLYTHAVAWTTELGHTAQQHRRLLSEVIVAGDDVPLAYDLPPIPAGARRDATAQISGRYVVIHAGTGDPKKEWPAEKWRELIRRLVAQAARIVLTGVGARERTLAATLASDQPGVLNLVGELDWQTFRAVLAHAEAAVGPDSVAMHVAAAEGTAAVAIMAAMSTPEYWRPLGARVSCVSGASVDDVMTALEQLIEIQRV